MLFCGIGRFGGGIFRDDLDFPVVAMIDTEDDLDLERDDRL